MNKLLLSTLLIASLGLSGCVGGILAGGAVVASTVHDRRSPGRIVDDRGLELKITRVLLADKYIDTYSHTNLTVFNGVVLVTGEAASQQVINHIIQKVQQVSGIKRIESDVIIGGKSSLISRGNDSAITTKVKTALLALKLPHFDPTLINVSSERGNVYLVGIVSQQEGHAIAQHASRVSGVKSVIKVFEYTK